jgi:hypothetical protein
MFRLEQNPRKRFMLGRDQALVFRSENALPKKQHLVGLFIPD